MAAVTTKARSAGRAVDEHGGAEPSAVVLFDPSGTAHAANAIQGLATAAANRRLPLVVHAPQPPRSSGALEWIPAEVGAMLADRAMRLAHRRALVAAIETAHADAVVCDLGLGRTIRSRGPRIPAGPRFVGVGHQTNAIDPRDDGRARDGQRGNLRVLRRLGRSGARIIVHTDAAARRFAEFVPAENISRAGWPVVATDDPCLRAPPPATEGVTLLFAGNARLVKGLPTLLEASRSVTGFDRLVVPGRIAPSALAQLDVSDPRLELWNRWLEADDYYRTLATASLVVLPYQHGYLRHGIYSSVMAEAMARGRPLVVSPSLGHLLPEGYAGAVIARDDTVAALAAALHEGIERRAALETEAMSAGRAHVRTHHTFEGYLSAIVEAGTA